MATNSGDFDVRTLNELRSLVGPDAVTSFLARLAEQFDGSFTSPPQDAEQIAVVRYQAHTLASTSGMLGFKALSDACVALETACRSHLATPGSVIPALAEALAARERAREQLTRMLSEEAVQDR